MLDSVSEIIELIELQPNNEIFFQSFMELDHSNLIQILSFESRFIESLLRDILKNDSYKSKQPLFYKMLHQKGGETQILTPVEIALENNQVVGLNRMIEFIVKYQNSYAFSFLFENEIVQLINKGIKCYILFESEIFCHCFELEDWPVIHTDDNSSIQPYNDSKFSLEGKYNAVFGHVYNCCDKDKPKSDKSEKYYKIKYTLNMLPAVIYDGEECLGVNDILEALGGTDEQIIFDSKIVQDFYEFQWENYAMHIHYFGAFIHFIYLIVFSAYVNDIYMYRNFDNRIAHSWAILICLIYPLFYDGLQLIKSGPSDYFQDPWNFIDQFHIWFGIINVALQRFSSDILHPMNILVMVSVTFIMLIKTFFYLRVFDSMSFLVSMLKQVFLDLRPFMAFLLILYWILALILSAIDWGNYEFDNDISVRGI
jgi:hypothetical protein